MHEKTIPNTLSKYSDKIDTSNIYIFIKSKKLSTGEWLGRRSFAPNHSSFS